MSGDNAPKIVNFAFNCYDHFYFQAFMKRLDAREVTFWGIFLDPTFD